MILMIQGMNVNIKERYHIIWHLFIALNLQVFFRQGDG